MDVLPAWRARLATHRFSLALITFSLLVATLCSVALPPIDRLDLGTTRAQPYLADFFAPEANTRFSYAFSSAQSGLWLPGFGGAATELALRVSGDRDAGLAPPPLTITLPDATPVTLPLRPGLAVYRLLVAPTHADLTVHLSSPTFIPLGADTRSLGVALDWVEIRQLTWGWAWPAPLAQLLLTLAAYGLALQLALTRRWALTAALLLLITSTVLLSAQPLLWAAHLPRLSILMLCLALLLQPLRRLTARLARAGSVTLTPTTELWLWRIVMLAALVKLGGVLSPQIIVYDLRWHVPRTEWLLAGRVLDLVLPSRVTLLGSTVGLEGGHFPYSPLWYFLIAPFGLLGADLGISSNVVNVTLDVTRSLLLAYLALRISGREKLALATALVYQLLPMPYWLISWGNWPTQLGLWGALLLACVFSAVGPAAMTRRQWLVLAGTAALAMATYTVMGVLAFLLIGIAVLVGWGMRRLQPLFVRQALLALVAGEALIFTIYHSWFVPTLFQDTLPVLLKNLNLRLSGTATTAVERAPLPTAAIDGAFLLNHLGWLGIGLIIAGLPLLWRSVPAGRPLTVAWLTIAGLFTAVSWLAVDMILKQYFFLLPLAALSGGAALEALWQRGRVGRLLVGLVIAVLALGVALRWYDLIMFKRHILAN